jgi:hypothetical protein
MALASSFAMASTPTQHSALHVLGRRNSACGPDAQYLHRRHYGHVFAVWAKRLEEGTYAMPLEDAAEKRREITGAELAAILSGIDLSVRSR